MYSGDSAIAQDSLGTLPSECLLQISVLELKGRKEKGEVPSPSTLSLLTTFLFSVWLCLFYKCISYKWTHRKLFRNT